MPDISRTAQRMDCAGLHLTSPIDKMPPGAFPYLINARVVEEGRIEGRVGITQFAKLQDVPNSIRRLNDPSGNYAPSGYIYVGGGGNKLYAGVETAYNIVDNGYSGDPLSLISFRPNDSPASWMYIFDKNKSSKIRPDGLLRGVGVPPPPTAPIIEYGPPVSINVHKGDQTTNWATFGIDTTITEGDRTGGTGPTIGAIIYNEDSVGWACMRPSTAPTIPWATQRMKITLNSGGSNAENVLVREIHPAINATTINAIAYDAGTNGLCAVCLTGNPSGLARNSLLQLGSETVRVLEVNTSPTGSSDYSIRCSTMATHVIGETVTGITSWYVFTKQAHNIGEPISSGYIAVDHATGIGGIDFTYTNITDLSMAGGRVLDPANDYMHISLYLTDPTVITSIELMFALDAVPNFSFTNPGNALTFTITPSQLLGASANGWVDIIVPISSGARSGSDFTRTLATVSGIAIQLTTTGTCNWGFDWWYLSGTYGPTVAINSPVGIVYSSSFRDSTTGAQSVSSPVTRYALFPLRESVIITLSVSSTSGVDSIDMYRLGGQVATLSYVATTTNVAGATHTDALTDLAVNDIARTPDSLALQPWPIHQPPWAGTCDVIGTSVFWKGGPEFNSALIGATAITINGTTYLTFGQPVSDIFLQLTQHAGYQVNAQFQISSPTLAGQPLPYVFGPLEGPFAPVVFALGDPLNGGLLYFSNFSDLDAASDQNTLEISPPSDNLVSGDIYSGMVFVGNRDDLFCVRFSYLTQIGASNSNQFQWARVPVPSGIWSRWACCTTPIGVAYLGRDGIYIATEQGGTNITDADLYPMFPHEGQPAATVQWGPDSSSSIPPVDMTQYRNLRLTYCDEQLYFSYVDIGGNWNTLRYQIYKKRWLLDHFANAISSHYLVEGSATSPSDEEILALAMDTRSIVKHGGNTDNGNTIFTVLITPSDDSKDERSQKLYVDYMLLADGAGQLTAAATYDNVSSFSAISNFTCVAGAPTPFISGGLTRFGALGLHRNIGMKLSWTGGPSGPRIYSWESSGFLQPYLSTFFVVQVSILSFPGWKSLRRMYPAYIANAPLYVTVLTQDGRSFGPYTLPSTNGVYRVIPQMLDHGIKDLAIALQVDGKGNPFALFLSDFVIEAKEWNEESYIKLAVFKA